MGVYDATFEAVGYPDWNSLASAVHDQKQQSAITSFLDSFVIHSGVSQSVLGSAILRIWGHGASNY